MIECLPTKFMVNDEGIEPLFHCTNSMSRGIYVKLCTSLFTFVLSNIEVNVHIVGQKTCL